MTLDDMANVNELASSLVQGGLLMARTFRPKATSKCIEMHQER